MYKIGDRIRMKTEKELSEFYKNKGMYNTYSVILEHGTFSVDGYNFSRSMYEFCGQEFTVGSIEWGGRIFTKCEAIRKQTSFRSRSGLLFIESMFSLCGKVYKCIDNDYFNGDTRISVDDKRKFHYYRISPEWISEAKGMDFSIDEEKILSII